MKVSITSSALTNHLAAVNNFQEIFELASDCRVNNCAHRNEPHYAVKAAIENGEISDVRYDNYLQIIAEIEDQNYWERHSDV